ncbi:MAG: transposase [Phycisphaeraceae bacterium]|nr:transposase [Phycisphaeraceae bacterium]MBX3367603.1 transposase [Phycisphaeraceae bacterium]
MPAPAYFLTWHTYGTWLHGDDAGSVDREHNSRGTPRLSPDPERFQRSLVSLAHAPLVLTREARHDVESVMRSHCTRRNWTLKAISVRSNHVHVVVLSWVDGSRPVSFVEPETIVKQLKDWGTRELRRRGHIADRQPAWTDHASTIHLFEPESLGAAIRYVSEMQDDRTPIRGREDWDVKLGLRPRTRRVDDNSCSQ